MKNYKCFNQVENFNIKYMYFDDLNEIEIQMLINGHNILGFQRGNKSYTTRWNLDELVLWLRTFLDNISLDPYPVDSDVEFAALKDIDARKFDAENIEEFDKYYDMLDEWDMRHRWHTANDGAILADIYFQLVDDNIEISWNNQDAEKDVDFKYKLGGAKIPKQMFISTVNDFLIDYANHWFNK